MILLVDDSPTIRSVLKVYLMGLGREFVEAEDGVRALRLVRLMEIELIIADVNMPVMDGLTFARELRASADQRLRTVPVILLTSEKGPEIETKGREAGVQAILHKPVDPVNLKQAVEPLLKKTGKR
jgi:two-component system chemotaxis response regulator CheY